MTEAVQLKSKSNQKDNTTTRVSVLENQVITIAHNIEKLDQKVETQYHTLHSRISDLRDDLRSDFEDKNEKFCEKLDAHTAQSAQQLDGIKEKLSELEKWRWMLVGAAVVVGYILAHVNLGKFFG